MSLVYILYLPYYGPHLLPVLSILLSMNTCRGYAHILHPRMALVQSYQSNRTDLDTVFSDAEQRPDAAMMTNSHHAPLPALSRIYRDTYGDGHMDHLRRQHSKFPKIRKL